MTGMEEIESALIKRLTILSDLPDVAWPNMPFTPTPGRPYFKPALLPGEPTQAGIGESAMNRMSGIFQVAVFVPAGIGTKDLRTMCSALEAHFKRGTVLNYNGVKVTIRKAYRGPQLQEANWLQCPVTISFFALTEN